MVFADFRFKTNNIETKILVEKGRLSMATEIEILLQSFTETNKTIEEMRNQKIRLEERYNSGKAQLDALVKEITALGYNPQDLQATINTETEAAKAAWAEICKKIQEAKAILNSING